MKVYHLTHWAKVVFEIGNCFCKIYLQISKTSTSNSGILKWFCQGVWTIGKSKLKMKISFKNIIHFHNRKHTLRLMLKLNENCAKTKSSSEQSIWGHFLEADLRLENGKVSVASNLFARIILVLSDTHVIAEKESTCESKAGWTCCNAILVAYYT